MSWDPITQPQDYVRILGFRSPGLATVTGASSPRHWDERKGYGLSGAFVVYRGKGLSHFEVRLRLLTPQDWADWEAWKPLVDVPPPTRPALALSIQHPLLDQVGINECVVEDVSQPEQTDDGEWTITIKMVEFRRPKLTLAKPEGAAATPTDPVEEEVIKPLMDQAEELAR